MGLFRRESRTPVTRELRDPKAATQQLRFVSPGQAQVNEWDARQAINFGYLANVISYRCIGMIAGALASKPFRAGLEPPATPGAASDYNPDARLAQLLGPQPGGPNPDCSARKLWEWTIIQRMVTGCNGWEIELDGDQIVGLWPLTSANIRAIPAAGGNRYFRSYQFGPPDNLTSLSREQMHYGWDPNALDWRQPVSALQSARYDLSIALANDRHTFGFMKNNAVPAHIVVVDEFDTTEDFEAYKRQWAGAYTGPDNVGKTHFHEASGDGPLNESIHIETLGMSAKDSRLIEQHKTSLGNIAISLGVPWSMLDASGRTYDNAAAEEITFWNKAVLPWANKLTEEVNATLAPRLGSEFGWFDLTSVEALQPAADVNETEALYRIGAISIDEVRMRHGLTGPAPVPPEPVVVVSALPATTEDSDDGVQPRAAIGEDRRTGSPARQGREVEGQAGRVAAQDHPDPGQEVRATELQELRRAAIWKATDALLVRHEKLWETEFRKLFARQQKHTLTRLEGVKRSKKITAITRPEDVRAIEDPPFDPAFWRDETEDLARTLYSQLASSAFVRLEGDFGVSFDLEAEFAQLFVNNRANQLAGIVTDTTYSQITQSMMDGIVEGESIPKIAARIRDVFEQATTNRATVIARTEVLSGFNASALAAASSLPPDVVAGKQWIATRDGRTRKSHGDTDGDIVAIDQMFLVGGAGAMYPGNPSLPAKESVNCRCAIVFLTPEQFSSEVALQMEAQASVPVPIERARVALALVTEGLLDEPRLRRALEVAS